MPAPVLQVKRGALSNLPGLRAGEPAFTTDTYDFYVGVNTTTGGNKFLGSYRYWSKETASKGSGVNLVESTGGSDFITLAAPASVGAALTYYFPASQGAPSSVLTNDGNGNLTWGSGSSNAVFSGITTFSDTTDSTTKDNGAVIIEGGVGIEKSVNIGGNLYVTGLSTFNGLVVDNNGMNVSGFSTIYDLHVLSNFNVGGRFDLDGPFYADNDARFLGITSFTNTTQSTNYNNGAVVLDGGLGVEKNVNIGGNLNVFGDVSIGGTTVSIKGIDVFIENKDIILGYTTSIVPNDDTANHAGVAIASTIGTPLSSFSASGINTLPDTYKQLMWFKSGTLGFSTDAFAFNYGLAIGTTTMANGVRLAVGSGITMSDTSIYASSFNGTFNGTFSGVVDNALYAANAGVSTQVKTVTAGDSAGNYYITFVNSHNGSATAETVYTDDGIYYDPGANKFTTQYALFTGSVQIQDGLNVSGGITTVGNLNVTGTTNITGSLTGTISTATRANSIDVVGVATNKNYYITLVDGSGTAQSVGVDAELLYNPNTNTLTLGTGVGVTQFSGSVSLGSSVSSVPTSKAIIDYVGTQVGNVDLTLGINADTGGPSTVNTSQTLNIFGTANEVETSVSGQTITVGLPNTVNITTLLDVPTIEVTDVKSRNGASAITITDTTGAVGFANSVTINGDLYVFGTTTEVNTSTLKVEDALIDLGLVNNGGVLQPPSSDLNLDIGILLNWYSGSAKKASVFWDDSAQRVGIASDVTEVAGTLTVNEYANIEVKSLWVTDCAGTSQVISCSGTERFLNNITVDAGTF